MRIHFMNLITMRNICMKKDCCIKIIVYNNLYKKPVYKLLLIKANYTNKFNTTAIIFELFYRNYLYI